MGRIRTIKPDFFRHELLQEIEQSNAKLRPMLVFAGLWTCCDKNGCFEWKPRSLKLDILPFIPFQMDSTLELLRESGLVEKYEVDGRTYGFIPTFSEHQRITGKEKEAPGKYPEPLRGNIGETPEKHPGEQEGKGKGNKERKGEGLRAIAPPVPVRVTACVQPDWEADEEANIPPGLTMIQLRQFVCERLGEAKTYTNQVAFQDAIEAVMKHEGMSPEDATRTVIERGRDHPPEKGAWKFWVSDGGWKATVAAGVSIEGLE